MFRFPRALFITGTDTGIGKSVVSALLVKGLNGTYWKPIQSGLKGETDRDFVRRVTGLTESHYVRERFRLSEPLSPHASAAIDGVTIGLRDFTLPDYSTDHLIVEGAGGLMVPLNEEQMIIDLIQHLSLPVLLVAKSELGTLNHTFLSLEALRRRNLEILGVIMNGPGNESNKRAIEKYGDVKVLAELEILEEIDPSILDRKFNLYFSNR